MSQKDMFRPLLRVLLAGAIFFSLFPMGNFAKKIRTLRCWDCVHDECTQPKESQCDRKTVEFNNLQLREVFEDVPRRKSNAFGCLWLDYREENNDDSLYRMRFCVDAESEICNRKIRENFSIVKCKVCTTDLCKAQRKIETLISSSQSRSGIIFTNFIFGLSGFYVLYFLISILSNANLIARSTWMS